MVQLITGLDFWSIVLWVVVGGIVVAFIIYVIRDVYSHITHSTGFSAWALNTNDRAAEDFRELVNLAKEHLHVVAGGDPGFWGRSDVIHAIERTSKRLGVSSVVFVVPPELPEPSDESAHPLRELQQRNVIILRHADKSPSRHFRIVDGLHFTLEGPHNVGIEERWYRTARDTRYAGAVLEKEFRAA